MINVRPPCQVDRLGLGELVEEDRDGREVEHGVRHHAEIVAEADAERTDTDAATRSRLNVGDRADGEGDEDEGKERHNMDRHGPGRDEGWSRLPFHERSEEALQPGHDRDDAGADDHRRAGRSLPSPLLFENLYRLHVICSLHRRPVCRTAATSMTMSMGPENMARPTARAGDRHGGVRPASPAPCR